jgi:hypothetical protein
MKRESSATPVYFAIIVVALGPFGLWSAFVAIRLWEWFLTPSLRFDPSFPQMYGLFAVVGLFRTARYVKDGTFDWKDAVTGSLMSPALLLLAGYLVHAGMHRL